MPPFLLTVLKIVFLALLYLFVFRALRSAVGDLRPATPPPETGTRPGSPSSRGGRPRAVPRSITVTNEKGSKVGTHTLDGTLQLGRAEACHIQLDDTFASQFHARIYSRDGSWWVEDLGSTNGTYLNQRKLTEPAELRAGDRLKIGKTVLELRR